MAVIPLLGIINASVGQAPFQFSNGGNAALGVPAFMNGTGNWGNWGYGFPNGGYFGLRFIFRSISMSGQYNYPLGGPTDGVPGYVPYQFAGGTVNSFGIFIYDTSMPNPALYNPVVSNSSGGAYGAEYCMADYGNGAFLDTGNQDTNGKYISLIYKIPMPNILFQNYKGNFAGAKIRTDTTPLGNNYDRSIRLSNYDFLSGSFKPLFRTDRQTLVTNSNVLAGQSVNTTPTQNTTANYTVSILYNAFGFPYAVYTPGPYSGNRALIHGNLGTGFVQMNSTNYLSAFNYIVPYPAGAIPVPFRVSFSDPNDDAAINGVGSVLQHVVTETPGGNFLFKPGNPNTVYPNQNVYLLVKPDLSGYYRVIFNGTSTAAQVAIAQSQGNNNQQGFGIDLNGNYWFMSYTGGATMPVLYSTLNLSSSIKLVLLPNLGARSLACKRLYSPQRFIYEG